MGEPIILHPASMGFDAASRREWILTNGLGGYSSQTIAGYNTRKYHGLLVSSEGELDRRIVLQQTVEELKIGDTIHCLSVNDYVGGTDSRGFQTLKTFVGAQNHVVFHHEFGDVSLAKTIQSIDGQNAVLLAYEMENGSDQEVSLKVRPLVSFRGIHEIKNTPDQFSQNESSQGALKVSCPKGELILRSNYMHVDIDPLWYRDFNYILEKERGEGHIEDAYSPGTLGIACGPNSSNKAVITAIYGGDPHFSLRISAQRNFETDTLHRLLQQADSFVVDIMGQKSIIAGYHWFRDWGRDTMISLSGIALLGKKLDIAESVLLRFIDHIKDGRIPTRFTSKGPIYYDFDGTLWMFDRLKEYLKVAGIERSKRILEPRWESLKSVPKHYSKNLKDGLLMNKSGTWMDTLERDCAVEVQGLWYNALNVIEGLSVVMDDPMDLSGLKSDFESSFMDRFYNGQYLKDTLDDDSFRPNQAIVLSLDYNPVGESEASDILRQIDERLLTPVGLRTLDPQDPSYCPTYAGGVRERERAYHNGTVWPWLLGPYCRACRIIGGQTGRRYNDAILSNAVQMMGQNCIGTLNEIYDAQAPHTPRGAVSQAWSVAEILRAYVEDTLSQKTL